MKNDRPTILSIAAGMTMALTLSTTAAAEEQELPDIQYGLWETTTVTTMRSDFMDMPGQTMTTKDCVTEEDVREGRAFLQDSEDCEVLEQEITSSSMDLTLMCNQPETGEVRMTMSMQLTGDTSQGTMKGEIDSPMGKMFMDISMDSRRIGDC